MIPHRLVVYLFILLAFMGCTKNEDKPDGILQPLPDTAFQTPANADIVMYEVNLRAFSSTGDLQGVIGRLGEIRELGVNVIWLMPIHPIGQINSVNSPYSVQNYLEVNPEFGTLDDLKNLVAKAHQKKMAVILDWVANHTAWDNPWISNQDWYSQDGNGNIIVPPGTNWTDVADLNYSNPAMRLAMIEAMKFWIEQADIDGFRCDAADMVPFDFWQQANQALSEFTDKNLVMLAEGARNDHFTAGFDLNFSWDFYSRLKDVFQGSSTPAMLYVVHQSNYSNLPAGKHKLRFTTNHDESAWDATPMVIFQGEAGALAASVITIFLGGVPLIYSSQEVGIIQNVPFFSNVPINWSNNPGMLAAYKKIFGFYSSHPVARTGTLSTFNHPAVVMFTLTLDTDQVLILANTKNVDQMVNMPAQLANQEWDDIMAGSQLNVGSEILLGPYEFLILD